jgi:hypothetical protein
MFRGVYSVYMDGVCINGSVHGVNMVVRFTTKQKGI